MSKSRRARFVALSALLGAPPSRPRSTRDLRRPGARRRPSPCEPRRSRARRCVHPCSVRASSARCDQALPCARRVHSDGRWPCRVDIGASAGGFTTALLERGAIRVYAVDVGVGQLLTDFAQTTGSSTSKGETSPTSHMSTVPEPVGLITMDLSYLPVAVAVPQLAPLSIADAADLIVLVKPTFELRRATLARSDDDITEAIRRATAAMIRCGWIISGTCVAPTTGRGAHAGSLHPRETCRRNGRLDHLPKTDGRYVTERGSLVTASIPWSSGSAATV